MHRNGKRNSLLYRLYFKYVYRHVFSNIYDTRRLSCRIHSVGEYMHGNLNYAGNLSGGI
jgi:hypothetical protein